MQLGKSWGKEKKAYNEVLRESAMIACKTQIMRNILTEFYYEKLNTSEQLLLKDLLRHILGVINKRKDNYDNCIVFHQKIARNYKLRSFLLSLSRYLIDIGKRANDSSPTVDNISNHMIGCIIGEFCEGPSCSSVYTARLDQVDPIISLFFEPPSESFWGKSGLGYSETILLFEEYSSLKDLKQDPEVVITKTENAKRKLAQIVRELKKTFDEQNENLIKVLQTIVAKQGSYKKSQARLTDLLVSGLGNCEARHRFFVALIIDLLQGTEKYAHEILISRGVIDLQGESNGHVTTVVEVNCKKFLLDGTARKLPEKLESSLDLRCAHLLDYNNILCKLGYRPIQFVYEATGSSRANESKIIEEIGQLVPEDYGHKFASAQTEQKKTVPAFSTNSQLPIMYNDTGKAVVMTRAMLAELGLPLGEVSRYELPKLPNNLPQSLAPILLVCSMFGLAINKCTDPLDDPVPNRLNNVNSSVVEMDMPEEKPISADFGGESIEKETDDPDTLKCFLPYGYTVSNDVKIVMDEVNKNKNAKYLLLDVNISSYFYANIKNRKEETKNLNTYNKFIENKPLGQFVIHNSFSKEKFFHDETIKVVRDKDSIGYKFKLNIFRFTAMTLLDLKVGKKYSLTKEDIDKIRKVVMEENDEYRIYLVGEDPDGIFKGLLHGYCKKSQLKACINNMNTDELDYFKD